MNTENKMIVDTGNSSMAGYTEFTYTQVGDYLFPNLTLDPQPEGEIGVWGWRRKLYLKERRKGTYNALLMKGTLTQHLIDTNAAALDMMEILVKKMTAAEGVTEQLKRRDQMAWVGAMNSIRARADEIVRAELIEV